jgi:hypothetical protein
MHRLVIALTTALAAAGAAVVGSYFFLANASGDAAARMAPADTVMYINVYLQPSAGQRMNLNELIQRFPGFGDPASLDAKIDELLQNLLGSSGVDYRSDIKPWLGDQVALGLGPFDSELFEAPGGLGVPSTPVDPADPMAGVGVAAYVAVTDPAAAEAAIQRAASDTEFAVEDHAGVTLNVGDEAAYAFVGEMLVISTSADRLRDVVDAQQGNAPTLADSDRYAEALSRVPADHLASMYFDTPAFAELTGQPGTEGFGAMAMALTAETTGLKLSGSLPFDAAVITDEQRAVLDLGREPSSLTGWLPANTQAEMVVFGLAQTLRVAEAQMREQDANGEIAGMLDQGRTMVQLFAGVDVDEELLPIFDRDLAVAFSGLVGPIPAVSVVVQPSDPAAAEATLGKITSALAAHGFETSTSDLDGTTVTTITIPDFVPISYAVRDGVIVAAPGAAIIETVFDAHESGDSLAGSELYQEAFALAGERAGNEGFVDVQGLLNLVSLFAGMDADTRETLEPVRALAFTTPASEDSQAFHLVLTVR